MHGVTTVVVVVVIPKRVSAQEKQRQIVQVLLFGKRVERVNVHNHQKNPQNQKHPGVNWPFMNAKDQKSVHVLG
jgi:hypothetical protein